MKKVKWAEITVNGRKYRPEVQEGLTLLRYLRDSLHLYGAKNGCGRGQCGACTVIVNGKARQACVVKMIHLQGAVIQTIEGLAADGRLHPLQTAFIKAGAIQCGFCTPGMILAAKALLDANPNPSPEEIKSALRFNLCRCTGYVAILRAVELAAAVLRGDRKFAPDPQGGVGVSVVRKDAVAKATGFPLYTDDMSFPNLLFGKILYSQYPYAEIRSIDTSEARKHPGVGLVITAKDIPGRKTFGLLNPNQQVLAEERVLYIGDSLAVVFAETEEEAAAARDLIKVEYKPLRGIYSLEDALQENAPVLHEKGRIVGHTKVRRGDVVRGFAQADVIVEEDYTVPSVEHAYLEPECALAKVEEDGTLTVWSGNQGSQPYREMIAKTLALAIEKVRVIGNPAGGAFGGKEEPTVQIHCALGAYATGRPVKITMTREESIRVSTKRHAERLHYKLGARKDGKLVAFEADVLADTGAYDSVGAPVVFRSGVVTAGPYTIPNVKTDSRGFYTNHPPGGAFRGFGSTQVAFAAEVHMDILARKLGIDPFELRMRNALETGKQTITGQTLGPGVGLRKSLEAVRQALAREKGRFRPGPGGKIGVGIACAYKNVGIGSGKKDKAGAAIELGADGRLVLKIEAAEIGQGCGTIMAQIACEATGIPFERFEPICNDTGVTPVGAVTTASRETYISGNAVFHAAKDLVTKLYFRLQKFYGINRENASFDEQGIKDLQTGLEIPWSALARKLADEGETLRSEYEYISPATVPLPDDCLPKDGDGPEKFQIHFAYCFATHGAIVEVEESTGRVKVLKIIAAHDCGRAINPQMFKGQIEGGVGMGLGYALSEEFVLKGGRVVTDTLNKLNLPKITDAPEIEVIAIEEEDPGGPFGAKGIGELPVNPVAPAVVNAIFDAVGVRITSLPANPEKVLAALRLRGKGQAGS